MTFRKAILLSGGLSMIAFLVACGGSSTPQTIPPTIKITTTVGTPQSAIVGTEFTTAFSVTVTSNGSPASGVSVTFTAPSGEPNGTFATGGATDTETTNSSGVATTLQAFTAGTEEGSYNVTATTSGAATPATFALSNTAGPAADLAISSGNDQDPGFGGSYKPLVVQVTDSDGNGVSGVSITFTITGNSAASGSFTGGATTETQSTDADGNATVSDLVANPTEVGGQFTVTAAPTTVTLTPTSVTFIETVIIPK